MMKMKMKSKKNPKRIILMKKIMQIAYQNKMKIMQLPMNKLIKILITSKETVIIIKKIQIKIRKKQLLM